MYASSRLRLLSAALLLGVAAPLAYAGSPGDAPMAARTNADIVDTAIAAGQFKTLAAALGAAGLVDTLKGTGPFTVFAPTDAAFAALPQGTVESLLQPENRDQLIAVLTYHVVPGRVMAAEAAGLDTADTANGEAIEFQASGGALTVDGARITKSDIAASNGVIHVIDKVLMP